MKHIQEMEVDIDSSHVEGPREVMCQGFGH